MYLIMEFVYLEHLAQQGCSGQVKMLEDAFFLSINYTEMLSKVSQQMLQELVLFILENE